MYNTLKRIYQSTTDKTYLEKAVARGWITEEQMNKIIDEVGGKD